MTINRNWKVAVALTCGAAPCVGQAKLELFPFVSAAARYDDNVFRYRDGDEAFAARGDRRQSDTVMQYVGGVTSTYAIGLQTFNLNASASKFEYDHFKDLDYKGHNINGGLNWQIGSLLKGDIKASDQRDLQDFDTTSDTSERSLRDQTNGTATFNIKLFQDYELRPRVGASRARYSRGTSRQQDLDEESYALALSYIGRGTISVGVEGVFKQGDFIRRDPLAGAVEEYDETTLQLVGRWSPSAVTSVDYALGSSRRKNEGIDVQNDSAVVGSLNFSRNVSVKTTIFSGIYRNISSAQRAGESTVISSGINAGASWRATPFIVLSGSTFYGQEDFQDSVLVDEDRKDKVRGASLSVAYSVDRTSEVTSEEYDAFQAGLELKLIFPIR